MQLHEARMTFTCALSQTNQKIVTSVERSALTMPSAMAKKVSLFSRLSSNIMAWYMCVHFCEAVTMTHFNRIEVRCTSFLQYQKYSFFMLALPCRVTAYVRFGTKNMTRYVGHLPNSVKRLAVYNHARFNCNSTFFHTCCEVPACSSTYCSTAWREGPAILRELAVIGLHASKIWGTLRIVNPEDGGLGTISGSQGASKHSLPPIIPPHLCLQRHMMTPEECSIQPDVPDHRAFKIERRSLPSGCTTKTWTWIPK